MTAEANPGIFKTIKEVLGRRLRIGPASKPIEKQDDVVSKTPILEQADPGLSSTLSLVAEVSVPAVVLMPEKPLDFLVVIADDNDDARSITKYMVKRALALEGDNARAIAPTSSSDFFQ